MKRCSTPLIIRETQIKTTVRHITSHWSEWPSSENLQTIHAGEDLLEKKSTLSHWWWKCKRIQALRRTVGRFLKKLKIKPPHEPATPLLGRYPEETKTEKDTCSPRLIAALDTAARTRKHPGCPSIDEQAKKWYIHTVEHGRSHEKVQTGSFVVFIERWDERPVRATASH